MQSTVTEPATAKKATTHGTMMTETATMQEGAIALRHGAVAAGLSIAVDAQLLID